MSMYFSFAQKKFKSSCAYRFDNIMSIAFCLLNVFIFTSLYKLMYSDHDAYAGITISAALTNFTLTFIINQTFFIDDFFISHKMDDGTIANEFLRPVDLRLRILAENLGEVLYSLIFQGIPTLLIVLTFVKIEAPKNTVSFVLFIISLILGYFILWSISLIIQMSSFFILNVWSIATIKDVFVHILAGVYIPLWFFPDWLRKIVSFTPFDSIYFLPIRFYLGEVKAEQMVFSFGKQIIWLIVLFFIANTMYIKGKKKLIVQGG